VGAMLIFDEVITGFRLGVGAASDLVGVTPDLWCFGKVIGGGLPLGAFGGRAELMEALAPSGDVYQAGTLAGNPLATAAGLAVLEHVDRHDHELLCERVGRFAGDLEQALCDGGLCARVDVAGPLVGLLVRPPNERFAKVCDLSDVRAVVGSEAYPRLFHAMARRGVALPPGPYEVLFPGMAHGDAELDAVLDAARHAAAEVAVSFR
ncbi:MAG: aminotransferase class III-fold pyridoxal phosphate-dependent enzyme, partial [Acidimicrobiales bacterium]